MTSDRRRPGSAEEQIYVTLGKGWAIVDLAGMLGPSFLTALELGLAGDDAAPPPNAIAHDLQLLRRRVSEEGVRLLACRRRGEACDVLTLALPSNGGALEDPVRAAQSARRTVRLDHASAILHERIGGEDGDDGSWPVCVQLATHAPQDDRGVVLTLLSTETEMESQLRQEAIEIASSLSMRPPAATPDLRWTG